MTTPTDQLPIRLAKGDPAPEDCVAVPLHGPPGWTWRGLAGEMIDLGDWEGEAFFIQAIADAAEAPLPLRKGDRVRVGGVEVVDVYESETHPGFCWVQYETNGVTHRVPLSAVTRIDDENESSANPLASTTREDGASGDAASCDEGHIEGAGGSQDPGPTPDWTPHEGQLVERISNGEYMRLEEQAGIGWRYKRLDRGLSGWMGSSALANGYRPRYLRVGDVIVAVNEDTSHPVVGEAIVAFTPQGLTTDFHRVRHNYDIVHIEGLGPVPWPLTEEVDQ